jgi:hypothetical protein
VFGRSEMTSGHIPAKGEPGPDEILGALREAVVDNPRLEEMPAEEVARQLVLEGGLQQEPSSALVAEMLDALEAEEPSEEGNPT